MLCMPALLFPHMLPRLHAFDPQSTAHCTSSHNGQTRASASPRTGRPLWVSSRRIPISVEAVSTSSEVLPSRTYYMGFAMIVYSYVKWCNASKWCNNWCDVIQLMWCNTTGYDVIHAIEMYYITSSCITSHQSLHHLDALHHLTSEYTNIANLV